MQSRRVFLFESVAAVAAVLGLTKILGPAPVAQVSSSDLARTSGPAMDDMPGMAGVPTGTRVLGSETLHFPGHSVQLSESADVVMATVDGRATVHLMRVANGGLHTHLLPFTVYSDSRTLMRDVLDCAKQGLFIL